jgi:hypothetical protein
MHSSSSPPLALSTLKLVQNRTNKNLFVGSLIKWCLHPCKTTAVNLLKQSQGPGYPALTAPDRADLGIAIVGRTRRRVAQTTCSGNQIEAAQAKRRFLELIPSAA